MARPPHQFDRAANAAAAEAREQGRRRDAGLVHFGGDLRRTNNYTCDPFGARGVHKLDPPANQDIRRRDRVNAPHARVVAASVLA